MIEGDGVDTITRVNKDRVKVKGKCNNSNKPKLKLSMFDVKIDWPPESPDNQYHLNK